MGLTPVARSCMGRPGLGCCKIGRITSYMGPLQEPSLVGSHMEGSNNHSQMAGLKGESLLRLGLH